MARVDTIEGTMDKEAWVGGMQVAVGIGGGGSTKDPLHAVLSLSKLSIQCYAVLRSNAHTPSLSL